MEHARPVATAFALLLPFSATWSVADAAGSSPHSSIPAPIAGSTSHQIQFRRDDPEGQRIARKLLAKKLAQDVVVASEVPVLRTAWVKTSASQAPALFVMHGCSPTGNCGLYGFERSNGGWHQVLNSIAQTCALLPSSHQGRRDLVAQMHGSATDSALKTYSWRKNRYVRVSVRNVTHAR